jgi:hypothetical protein
MDGTVSRKVLLATLLLGSQFFGAITMAEDDDIPKGLYLGGAIAQARFEPEGLLNEDHENDSWKPILGWRPHEYVALEVSYVDFGERTGEAGRGMGRVPYDVSADADGYSAFAVALIPVPYVDFFAKVGVASIDSKSCYGIGGCEDFRLVTDSATKFAYGGGVQLRLRNLAFRAEYEKFETDLIDDLELISLGATYTFDFSR